MSLDIYELYLDVEEAFDVRLPEADMQGIKTVGDLCDTVVKNLREQNSVAQAGRTSDETATWEKLKALVALEQGLKPEQVARTTRLVEDLGFD